MSLELEIEDLQIAFDGAADQQHRVAGISRRAMAILEEVVSQNLLQLEVGAGGRSLPRVRAKPVEVDLTQSGDDQVARLVAQAIYAALLEQLRA